MWRSMVDEQVKERIEALSLPFNEYGLDPYGVSKEHLGFFYTVLKRMYRNYFRVKSFGVEHIPAQGRCLLIGNHSGSLPVDAGMVMASAFLEADPPRHVHGMVEKFAQYMPFLSLWFSRVGQFPGLPEHAVRLLEDERMLMVFPEGARGTGKLYKDRYQLVRFGTGFMRIALQTGTPIVPFSFIGGEEALPAVYHAKTLAKIAGTPYWPVPPYLLPIPLPKQCQIHYGAPMVFKGTGSESDEEIEHFVNQVSGRISELIDEGRRIRRKRLGREEKPGDDMSPEEEV